MGEPSDEHRWHEALERLGPEIVRAKPESRPENASSGIPTPAAGDAVPPEPVVDPLLHGRRGRELETAVAPLLGGGGRRRRRDRRAHRFARASAHVDALSLCRGRVHRSRRQRQRTGFTID